MHLHQLSLHGLVRSTRLSLSRLSSTPEECVERVCEQHLARGLPPPPPFRLLDDPLALLRALNKDAIEEINVMYVAMTRAMGTLYAGHAAAEWLRLAGVDFELEPTPMAADEPAAEAAHSGASMVGTVADAAASALAGAGAAGAAASVAAGAIGPTGARSSEQGGRDADADAEVVFAGERSVEERNAAGFAHAIDLDSESTPAAGGGAPSAPVHASEVPAAGGGAPPAPVHASKVAEGVDDGSEGDVHDEDVAIWQLAEQSHAHDRDQRHDHGAAQNEPSEQRAPRQSWPALAQDPVAASDPDPEAAEAGGRKRRRVGGPPRLQHDYLDL